LANLEMPSLELCAATPHVAQRLTADSIAVGTLRANETPTVLVGDWRYLTPPSATELLAAIERVRAGKRPAVSGGLSDLFW
jgi:hypothetical protein